MGSKENPWIDSWRLKRTASMRLFCFPHAGGGGFVFRSWQAHLPMDLEVCPIVLPGRANRFNEAPFDRMGPLIDEAAEALRNWFDKPFAFFGYSLGALVAFELACFIHRVYGLSPAHLFVAGRSAPHIACPYHPIHTLPESHFITELRKLSATSEELLQNEEAIRVFIPVLRADFAIAETYRYHPVPPLQCPITAIGGQEDLECEENDLREWRMHTDRGFEMKMFPGDHFFLFDHSEKVAGLVGTTLALGWGPNPHSGLYA